MDGGKIDGKAVTEEQLLELGYKKYYGEKIDVYFNGKVCAHAAECVRGDKNVFDLARKPWILPDAGESAEHTAEVIDRCPSGALKYIKH
jgi:uncharacterized Fe-S cluster protein YjdI